MNRDLIMASGYVLPFTEETAKRLNINYDEHQEEIDHYLNTLEGANFKIAVENVISDHKEIIVHANLNGKNIMVILFRYEEELGGTHDDLDDGFYFLFNENDLYERKLSPIGQMLEDDGELFPQYERWSIFI